MERCTTPAASTSSRPYSGPAFYRWQSRCHSAMQPNPYRTPTSPRAKPLDAYFPVRSVTASSSNLTASGSGSSNTATSDTSSSKSWGWLRGGKKDDGAAKASIALPGNNSSLDALSDLYAQLQPEEESSTDRGQREMCEGYLDKLLRGSPMVRFMVKQLSIVGCSPVGTEGGMDRIVLGKCQPGIAGGFMPSPEGAPRSQSGLLICYNGIIDKKHMENTMAHEMLHWFDHCRFKANWNDLRHVACSEIRAASLSGDCKFMREVSRGQFGFRKQHQVCVRRRAVISVEANPECPDKETAERMVDEVWESCFSDTRPFDEIY